MSALLCQLDRLLQNAFYAGKLQGSKDYMMALSWLSLLVAIMNDQVALLEEQLVNIICMA